MPDNLKSGIVKNSRTETVLNKSYQEMSKHYGTAILPARLRSPKGKAFVEGSVGVVSIWILAALRNRQFLFLMELNEVIHEKLETSNHKPFQGREGSRASCFEEDKLFLLPLPATPFELAVWKAATVQYNYHISVVRMNYSVPYEYIKQKVYVRLTQATVEVFFSGTRVASHLRLHGHPNQYSTVEEHMPPDHQIYLQWNGECFIRWADRPVHCCRGTPFSLCPQGGAAGIQVLYGPAETVRPLFLASSGEHLSESPLLHFFPQPEKHPVHSEIRAGRAAG